MSLRFLETSVGFDEAQALRIGELCKSRGQTRASLIRSAVREYLDREAGTDANLKRIAMMTEFTQVAVDILIREQAPDRREDILATVQERMERYHA